MNATVFLKPGRLRAGVRRHPWVYGNSIERVEGEYRDGDVVTVRAPDGRFVGHAFVNDRSRLRLRLVSFERDAAPEPALLRARVRDAVALRHDVLGLPARADAYRVVHSEGDGLPGLIVDRYGPALALSCSTLGLHQRLDVVLDALEESLAPACIVEQPLPEGLRAAEGLPEPRGVLRGALPADDPVVTVDGLAFTAPLRGGQKTGLFLDQRENARLVAAHAAGRRVLDACCYVGTFAVAAAKAGAAQVHAFDSSPEAVEQARANAARNGVADRVEVERGSLHKELRGRLDRGERYDLVVLDPPKFAAAARDVDRARKGYFDANQLALKLLAPGGLLFTFSCSHHVDEALFDEVLREASTRAEVDLRVIGRLGAGADHPTDLHCPEGRYLKGLALQRRGGNAP
ncbi:MAG: class I SAM-dependent rRNA methyltransferase [Planctomycetota bacterium]|nr:class I SAM-dependent rRNA methyltransferase [Planctomycetota bacterium]